MSKTYRELIDQCLDEIEVLTSHVRELLAEANGEGVDQMIKPSQQRDLFGDEDMETVPGNRLDKNQTEQAIARVIEHYQVEHPRSRPGTKERGKIRSRLKEKFTVRDLCDAIDGCHKSPYHCGENDSGTKYQGLELIVRDAKHVQQFIEINSGEGVGSSKKSFVSRHRGLSR